MKELYKVEIHSADCNGVLEGRHLFSNGIEDFFWYKDYTFYSGRIYALVGEFQQGNMYLSYLTGGQIDFENGLRVLWNGNDISRDKLAEISWNFEPNNTEYGDCIVKSSIEDILKKKCSPATFKQISQLFMLTGARFDRKLSQLSGERWRASAALGYAYGKKIFYAPYQSSEFYYNMLKRNSFQNVLQNLKNTGAIILLPVGSDDVLKDYADVCIYVKPDLF